MKKTLWVALLWGAMSVNALPIQKDEAFIQAIAKSQNSQKMILMIYTTDDCPECAYMKKKVFHDPAVEPFLTQHFEIIEKNVHRNALPDGYDYFGIPTMFFINHAGVNKETLVGSKRPKAFADELHRIWKKK